MLRALLSELIDRARSAFPPNRIVALLLPFYSAAAGAIAAYAAQHFPGLADVVSESQIEGVFVSVTLAAAAAGYKWLAGWQEYEGRHEFETDALLEQLECDREPAPEDQEAV